jgi:hypothetical protein
MGGGVRAGWPGQSVGVSVVGYLGQPGHLGMNSQMLVGLRAARSAEGCPAAAAGEPMASANPMPTAVTRIQREPALGGVSMPGRLHEWFPAADVPARLWPIGQSLR